MSTNSELAHSVWREVAVRLCRMKLSHLQVYIGLCLSVRYPVVPVCIATWVWVYVSAAWVYGPSSVDMLVKSFVLTCLGWSGLAGGACSPARKALLDKAFAGDAAAVQFLLSQGKDPNTIIRPQVKPRLCLGFFYQMYVKLYDFL